MKRLILLAIWIGAMAVPAPGGTAIAESRTPSSLAVYRGRIIDLRSSWEGASACWISDNGNYCYDSERAMDDVHGEPGDVTPFASCSSEVRLYDGVNHGGAMLGLDLRQVWIGLSTYGFSDRTSSYQIGACSSLLRDTGGTYYPGSTSAWSSATSMASGWNNRITSVYIY